VKDLCNRKRTTLHYLFWFLLLKVIVQDYNTATKDAHSDRVVDYFQATLVNTAKTILHMHVCAHFYIKMPHVFLPIPFHSQDQKAFPCSFLPLY
jgi:hypothetical protein